MHRLALRCVDHPRLTIALVIAVTAAFALLIPGMRFEPDFKKFLPEDDPAVQALHRAEATYGSQDFFMVSLEAPESIFNRETLRKFRELEERFKQFPEVDEVLGPTTVEVVTGTETALIVAPALGELPATPEALEAYRGKVMNDRRIKGFLISADGQAGGILIKVSPYVDNVLPLVNRIRQMVPDYVGPERVYMAGTPTLRTTIVESMNQDLRRLIPLIVAVMLIMLFFAFRTVRGVILPVLVVLISTIWSMGSMAITGVPLTPFSFIMPVMLIAIGKAYGIYTINRYHEEISKGDRSIKRVLRSTMEDMNHPLSLDALTTIAGFLALLVSFLWPQRLFGVFTALGIAYTLLLTFTFIPAVLALLPIPSQRRPYEENRSSRAMVQFGNFIARARFGVLMVAVAIFALFAVAVPRIRVETSPIEFLGKDHPLIRGMAMTERHFGGSQQVSIEIDTGRPDGLKDPEVLSRVEALEGYLHSQPLVGRVNSLVGVVKEMHQKLRADDPEFYMIPESPRAVAQLLLFFPTSALGNMAAPDFSKGEVIALIPQVSSIVLSKLVSEIQSYLDRELNSKGIRAELVGTERAFVSLMDRTAESTALTLGVSVLAAWVIVALLMRSLVAGLISIFTMVVTIVINMGAMVYMNQPIDMSTLMLGSIAVGVGIDYTINFLLRLRREIQRGASLEAAQRIAMQTIGRGILFNALTLTFGFGVLLFSAFKGWVIFGLLINLTMILSFLGALTLVPSILLIWKPRFLFDGLTANQMRLAMEPVRQTATETKEGLTK